MTLVKLLQRCSTYFQHEGRKTNDRTRSRMDSKEYMNNMLGGLVVGVLQMSEDCWNALTL